MIILYESRPNPVYIQFFFRVHHKVSEDKENKLLNPDDLPLMRSEIESTTNDNNTTDCNPYQLTEAHSVDDCVVVREEIQPFFYNRRLGFHLQLMI